MPTGRKQRNFLKDTKANLEDAYGSVFEAGSRFTTSGRARRSLELWGADNVLSMDDLGGISSFTWRKQNKHIKALWNIDPSAVWVTKTQRYAESR